MKNKMISLALGTLLLCSAPVMAEENLASPTPGNGTPVKVEVQKVSLQDGIKLPKELSQIHGYLTAKDFPKGTSASPMMLKDNGGKNLIYWVTTHEVDQDVVFLTAAAEVDQKDLPKEVAGLFAKGNLPIESAAYMQKVNYYLSGYSYMINDMVAKYVDTYNRRTKGEPLPYNILVVDPGFTEIIHPISKDSKTYTMSLNPKIYADSWLIPVYVRVYAKPEGNKVRFLLTASLDSSKKEAEAMAKTLVGIKK